MKLAKKKLILPYLCLPMLVLLFIPMMQGCALFGTKNDDRGEFKNVKSGNKQWDMPAPTGMVLVLSGSFMGGEVGPDIIGRVVNRSKQTTVSTFFMDEAEVTNLDYRAFLDVLFEKANNTDAQSGDTNAQANDTNDQPEDKLEKMLTKEFIMTKLYPDSNVWRNDFTHNMADILLESYYEHPAYNDYPVVGVSWEAARHFASWRTKYLNEYREGKELPPYPSFSLPSAAQWEYAARGGKELAKYPWGGPYIRDYEGKLRANFKSGKGNYNECGYTYTSPVTAFPPNDYGLYDMAGNVSEWTLDAYNPAATSRTWDLDPLYLDEDEPMKIIKGGSWKDISRFLQTGSIDYEHKDTARSYIGFRCVIPYTGVQVR